MGPNDGGHCSHRQFAEHPRDTHQQALKTAAKTPTRGGIHVGQGCKDEQHHTHLVHLATKTLASGRVAEFVNQLGEHHADVQQAQIGGREQTCGLVEQMIGLIGQGFQAPQDQCHIDTRAHGAKHHADQGQGFFQPAVRVEQWQFDGQEAQQNGFDLTAAALAETLKQTGSRSAAVKLQQIGQVQLAQQLHHLFLGQ